MSWFATRRQTPRHLISAICAVYLHQSSWEDLLSAYRTKRGGGIQFYLSTESTGELADTIPAGYEVYESVNGPVYLRKGGFQRLPGKKSNSLSGNSKSIAARIATSSKCSPNSWSFVKAHRGRRIFTQCSCDKKWRSLQNVLPTTWRSCALFLPQNIPGKEAQRIERLLDAIH